MCNRENCKTSLWTETPSDPLLAASPASSGQTSLPALPATGLGTEGDEAGLRCPRPGLRKQVHKPMQRQDQGQHMDTWALPAFGRLQQDGVRVGLFIQGWNGG